MSGNNIDTPNNPAARVYEILKQAVEFKFDHNTHVRSAWASVFGVQSKDTVEIYRCLADAAFQLDKARDFVLSLPEDGIRHKTYLEGFPFLRGVLTPDSLSSPWRDTVVSLKTHAAFANFKFTVDLLADKFGEAKIDEEALRSLEMEADEFFENVSKAEIDPELKTMLKEQSEVLRSSIRRYRINGIQGVRDAVFLWHSRMLGHSRALERRSDPVNSEWIDKMEKLVKTAFNLAQIAEIAKRLWTSVGFPLLPDK